METPEFVFRGSPLLLAWDAIMEKKEMKLEASLDSVISSEDKERKGCSRSSLTVALFSGFGSSHQLRKSRHSGLHLISIAGGSSSSLRKP